jgi:hypothetical protein
MAFTFALRREDGTPAGPGALEQPRRHVADRQLLELPPHDRNDHDGGADVRDDEQQLQQGREKDPLVVPCTGDVAGRISERRLVKAATPGST